MKNIISSLLLVLALAGFGACTQQTANEAATDTIQTDAADQKAYVCPMNCENSASDEPGQCPVCGMDLVKNENYVAPVSPSADYTQEGTVADSAATR